MFSEKLKQQREEKNLTQAELCKRVGIRRDSYNKYERKGIKPPYDVLARLAKELDVTADYLIAEKEQAETNDYVFVAGKNGVRQKFEIPSDKLERFKKLIEAGLPEILDKEHSDL
ncbi:hypothetical protein AGMMS49975_19270 [Clostridia bacterium]|nr:hypothetical protein AGMMS49975_19270 [Clostridia bacterium]